MRDGKPVRMSKRTGKAITLTDLLDEVPIDSARFFSISAKARPRWTLTLIWPCATTARTRSTMFSTPTRASARCCKKLESEGVKFEGAAAVDASVLTDPASRR